MIDLDFERLSEVNTFDAPMQQLWKRLEGKLIDSLQVLVVEALENKESQVKQAA